MADSLQPHGLKPTRLLHPWDSPGKNTGVGYHFLLQGIFPTQGSNPGLLHYRQTLYPLSHQDPSSIPLSGRSTREGTGYPLQHSWASLVAQLVKNPPAMPETWVPYLGWEDPLEKEIATHSSILTWRISWTIQLQRVRHN